MLGNFIDSRTDHLPDKINTSICIIGAGAAGISIAKNLNKVEDVVLVESGDFELDGKTQELYQGNNLELLYHDLMTCRLRYFGGTTNHWGGYCRANDPIDYEGRIDLDVPKWPVSQNELNPYITLAAKELGISTNFFDPERFLTEKGIPTDELLEKKSSDFSTKIFQISSNVRFSKIYREELSKQKNLRIYLNLNVVHIQLDENGNQVKCLIGKTLNGKQVIIEAKEFVFACHAIENARILLSSNDVINEGIGNAYDHVGRYFMDHVHIQASKLIPSESFPKLYDRSKLMMLKLNANLSFSDDFLRTSGILQYYCRFKPIYADDDMKEALSGFKSEVMKPFSNQIYEDIKKIVSDLDDAWDYSMTKIGTRPAIPKYYELDHRIEQAPNPESRVKLSSNKDFFGNPRADLNWKLNDLDYETFRVGHDKISKELSAMGLGRVVKEEITPALVNERAKGHYHHIGTTRMSENIEDGVVNKNCRVHGVSNLYMAGSSVFPTAGYSGPTMMIVAFALKLAEHLKLKIEK